MEKLRYTVKSYLASNSPVLIDTLETDIFNEVQDFIWDNCQAGYDCSLTDNKTGDTRIAYAPDFLEEDINIIGKLEDQLESGEDSIEFSTDNIEDAKKVKAFLDKKSISYFPTKYGNGYIFTISLGSDSDDDVFEDAFDYITELSNKLKDIQSNELDASEERENLTSLLTSISDCVMRLK